jgi:uncharacterized membrane protein YdbT with pleckstrin-like domain
MTMSETIIYRNHPSWLSFLGMLLLASASLLAGLGSRETSGWVVISAFLFFLTAILRFRRLYTITNARVIARVGLIANNSKEMELRHIRGMNVRQNVWERLLGIGTVELISVADAGAEVVLKGITDPTSLKENIRSITGGP